jgi:Domain of unknown function (DUF4281)
MTDSVFSAVSLAAITGWLGLAVASLLRNGSARKFLLLASGRMIPLALCLTYGAVLLWFWGTTSGGFDSLASVQALFASPGKMLGAWTHFLAFDLLVGRWMVDDAAQPGRTRLLLVPGLPLTFMYGPLGLLLYLACREIRALIVPAATP